MKALITGGARSGKSRHAQALAESLGPRRTYLATAEALDGEMAERIRRHQEDRGEGWVTVEEPIHIAPIIAGAELVLVDCLTLWITNLLMARGEDADLRPELDALVAAVAAAEGHVIFVTNEVGMGIVPMNRLARRFQDWSGWTSQALAPLMDQVVLTVAGLPLRLR
ncbi:bifunctional adenosylcobinamide kinase/adenosylcobinamide-phosphate guanylyltransferase [Myxococcota bacterium]|nr:bifunctional adenosylcobinamide kinase/adenosylcobinamide-phosphate guanylyltransferase [Myxococcota bacterium]